MLMWQRGRTAEENELHHMNEPHQHRQVAASLCSDAGRYDRARPGYPGAVVERNVAASQADTSRRTPLHHTP
jgi:hypothetical protein